jgi:arginine/serine-rich splicing factor 12
MKFNYILIGNIKNFLIIKEFFFYYSDTLTSTINAKVGYIKFDRSDSVYGALNMTNTIFIDKPLIVSQVFENNIPDETDAMIYCAPLNPNITLLSGGPTWPSTVINRLVGQPPNAFIETIDPELTDRNLPPYPPLPGILDISKVEEIRRTVYLSNLDKDVNKILFFKKKKFFYFN